MRRSIAFCVISCFCSSAFLYAQPHSAQSAAGPLTSLPPAAPVLASPGNGVSGVLSFDLTWNPVTHAASYSLQVSTDPEFGSFTTNQTGIEGTTHAAAEMQGDITYHWRVRAANVAGDGDFSAIWSFHTDQSLPVRLSSFSAEFDGGTVVVSWVTESEVDNIGFILERSSTPDYLDWQMLASYLNNDALQGQGNTSAQTVYTFTDTEAEPGLAVRYRLSSVDTRGDIHVYDVLDVLVPDSPEATELMAPYPNPFNPATKIQYTLAETGRVELSVYDIRGRKVRTLFSGHQRAGSYNYYWHGTDNTGAQAASGTYLIILRAPGITRTQKALFLR